MSVEWPFTILGRNFFEGQVPQLVKNLGRIATALEKIAEKQESRVPEVAEGHAEGCPQKYIPRKESNCGCW